VLKSSRLSSGSHPVNSQAARRRPGRLDPPVPAWVHDRRPAPRNYRM